MAIENRFIRIEDWNGNVYFPESNSGSSTSGVISDSSSASSDPSSKTYTDGIKVADSTANGGTALVLASSTQRQNLFVTSLSNIPFGDISIRMRIKSSIGSGSSNLIEMNTYFVDKSGEEATQTLLDTLYITGDMIGSANEYVNLGVVTNYKGVATDGSLLKIEIVMLSDTGCIIYFDQLATAMEMTSKGILSIDIEDDKIIINK